MRGPKAFIHLDHLVNNYHLVKNKVGQKRLVCVVKANAYGHGALECARTLYAAGCDYFAVFTVNEALDLRKAGINTEILVFNRLDEDNLDVAVRQNLTLNISHIDDLNILFKYKKKTGNCPPLHLKIDTGMTRLGVSAVEADTVMRKLALNRNINCLGIYSHLATADEGDLTFAYRQTKIFENVKNMALEFGLKFKYYHLSNSGAVLNLDQSNYNLVRVGMLLYGAFPSLEVERVMPIKPVMEFKAPVVSVRRVEAGTQVSYGGVYTTRHDTTIGVIECGFADGLPRAWYKMGYIMYNFKKYNIAGRICMDQFMVDFKGLKPEMGAEVLLLGEGRDGCIKMEDMAGAIDSTPYVISTRIGGRTQFIYEKSKKEKAS